MSKMYEIAFGIMAKLDSNFTKSFQSASAQTTLLKGKLLDFNEAQNKINKFKASKSQFAGIQQDLDKARKKAKELALELKNTEKPTKKMQNQFKAACEEVNRLESRMTAQKVTIQTLRKELGEAGISTQRLGDAQKSLAGNMLKTTSQIKKAEAAQARYNKVQALQDKVGDKRSNARGNMMGAVETAIMVAAPIIPAIQFESAMSGVAKQVDGARDDTGKLTDVYYQAQEKVMTASREMMIMPDTIAKAYEMAAKSGAKGIENIDMLARMGIKMGTAFEAPTEQITEDFAKIGNAMGLNLATKGGIEQLGQLADTVNYLDDQSNAAGSDIIDVLKRTSGTATALLPTLSRTTLAGMSTALLNMGETGETAGTALNSLFTKVAAAPTQAKSFHGALAQIGLTAEELQSGALMDAEGTITDLFDRIGKLDGASKNNVLAELFGNEHIKSLSKISGNYESFLKTIKMGNSDEAKGSMNKEFEIAAQTTARQMEGMKASTTRLSIVLATNLLPVIGQIAEGVSVAADGFTGFAQENKEVCGWASLLTAGIMAGTVALSAMAWVGWTVISPFVSLYAWSTKIQLGTKLWTGVQWAWNTAMTVGKGLLSVGKFILYYGAVAAGQGVMALVTAAQWAWNVAMSANPIGLVVAGIVGLVAAGTWMWQNWDEISQWLALAWDNPMAAIDQFIAGLRGEFGGVFAWLDEKWNWIAGLFSTPINANVQASASAKGEVQTYGDIEENARGGIYGKGAFLTTFAEESPEAAIPLDGSSRAIGLWQQAGEMLGMKPDLGVSTTGGMSGVNLAERENTSISATFAPQIHIAGNADAGTAQQIQQVLQDSLADFERKLNALQNQKARVSYA